MAGSVGNPVRFANPFRRVTGVGWPAAWIEVRTTLAGEVVSDSQQISCSPYVDPTGPASDTYMSEWNLAFSSSSVLLHRKGDTQGITFDSVVSGLPTPQSFAFDPWQYCTGARNVGGYGVYGVKGRWQSQTGDKVSVPGFGGLDNAYYSTMTAQAEGVGDTFTGGQICSGIILSGPTIVGHYYYTTCTGHELGVDEPHANASAYAQQSIDFSGVTVEYNGTIYEAVGLLLNQSEGVPNPTVGIVQILCRRQDAA